MSCIGGDGGELLFEASDALGYQYTVRHILAKCDCYIFIPKANLRPGAAHREIYWLFCQPLYDSAEELAP
jgi:hypothetical protein